MITVPTLLVDEKKCRRNIGRMAEKAKTNNLIFRPHFKTHQSHEIGRWFREEGVSKITCSSLTMAQFFAKDGWEDITVAFPVNVLEIDLINELASKINLNLLVESAEAVNMLSRGISESINAFIKVDLGAHRTGIDPTDINSIRRLIAELSKSDQITFLGFLGHAGHSYRCRKKEEILEVHAGSMELLSNLKRHFPEAFISFGDTPTCSIATSFGPCDELRPGNFCFYDLMQWQIGSCSQEEIAVAMACPVVAKHPERSEVVIYGGGVHFSKEFIEEDGQRVFGKVVGNDGEEWSHILPNVTLAKVSQEHGIIKAPADWIDKTSIGDMVKILPVHSCMTMDLLRTFQTV